MAGPSRLRRLLRSLVDRGQLSRVICQSCRPCCSICFLGVFRESTYVFFHVCRCMHVDGFSDIERMYGKRQPIAVRKPLASTGSRKRNGALPATPLQDCTDGLSTPPATEGETASETELETEIETDDTLTRKPSDSCHASRLSNDSLKGPAVQQLVSEHDLYHKYFRRDVVGLHNIDLLR